MRTTQLAGLALAAALAAACSSSSSSEPDVDYVGQSACRHLAGVVTDWVNGGLTDAEVAGKLRAEASTAAAASTPGLHDAYLAVIDATDPFVIEPLLNAQLGPMDKRCSKAGWPLLEE